MKLKKFLLILFASVCCVCLGLAFGCKVNNNNECTVKFEFSEHVKYVIDGKEVEERQLKVAKETMVTFSVVVEDGFLSDTLVVKADGETLAASNDVYSYRVTRNVTISATVSEDLLDVEDGVYLISSLKDLRFLAAMVNSGNSDYVTGEYRLETDIDCGGVQLDVIGNYENNTAFFSGIFDGQNHTISNYTISTNGKSYVGLFGCVQISTMSTSVIIQGLNLKNFTIEATAPEDANMRVGAIAAVTGGANIVACSAEGTININGDNNYYSYVGGAVGSQRSLSIAAADNLVYHYYGTTEYVHTNVAIKVKKGYVMSAGGVVGETISSHERGAAMVMNSYAEGNVDGAIRAGGVVGTLGDYSSIANCYATGKVSAKAYFSFEVTNAEYFAYAGGIAAYAGYETTISDSFTKCTLSADVDNAGMATGNFCAYVSPNDEFVNASTVFNCYAGNDAKPTEEDFVKNKLKWNDTDWVITDGEYPTTNFADGEVSFRITLNYLQNTVDGVGLSNKFVSVKDNSYFSFSSYIGDTKKEGSTSIVDEYVVADDKAHTSYGYFFDEDCTLRVHYSFIPTRDITLYVGFADYSKVKGTYEFVEESGRTVKLILNTDATYSYVDVMSFDGSYVYDDTKLIFNDALFARLSNDVLVNASNIPQPWLNYQPYKFVGTANISQGRLLLYDGMYFTNIAPLVFNSESTQTEVNQFVGTWERSATINEKYTFEPDMTWSYSWLGQEKSGGYNVTADGEATLSGDITGTARFDSNGLLLIEVGDSKKYFCREHSFYGNWYSEKDGNYLVLDGFGIDLAGGANAIIDGTVYDNLAYVKDGFFDDPQLGDNVYTIISGYSLVGYFYYNESTKTITACLFDENSSDVIEYSFILLDYYLGEWIGEDKIDEVPFTLMDFNGLGLYKADGDLSLGYIVINGTKVPYDCSISAQKGLVGTFEYKNKNYVLFTNGDGTVTISYDGAEANLYRKDEMASTPLVDGKNSVYKFDGGGKLTNGGILTVTSKKGVVTEYSYKIASGSIDGATDENGNVLRGFDIVINLYNKGSVDGNAIGTIEISYPKFVLKLAGQNEENLDLYFAFADKTWSIGTINNSFRIGKFDLSYKAVGTYNNGDNNVPFLYYPQYGYILVDYVKAGEGFESTRIINYLLLLDDSNIIISSYPYVVDGDLWYYASPSDELVGEWENTVTGARVQFDGLADSKYTEGIAWDRTNGTTYLYTRRFGTFYMWLEDGENVLKSYTVDYDRDDEDKTGANVYSKPNVMSGRITLDEVNILGGPIFTAVATNGTEYEFNFDGTVKVGNESGKYDLVEVNGNKTTVEITIDGTVMTVEVNHDGTAKIID